MDETTHSDAETFYTDKQLRERWQCSNMKLWRLRRQGKLKPLRKSKPLRWLLNYTRRRPHEP